MLQLQMLCQHLLDGSSKLVWDQSLHQGASTTHTFGSSTCNSQVNECLAQ